MGRSVSTNFVGTMFIAWLVGVVVFISDAGSTHVDR